MLEANLRPCTAEPLSETTARTGGRFEMIKSSEELATMVNIPEDTDLNLIGTIKSDDLFGYLLENLDEINFREHIGLEPDQRLMKKHLIVTVVDNVISLARDHTCNVATNHGFIYSYNGKHWDVIDERQLENFLGRAAEKMGVDRYSAQYHLFKSDLLKQFHSQAYLPKRDRANGAVLINLNNGTFEMDLSKPKLREFCPDDFLTYTLPFDYDPHAKAPQFMKYLEEVLPDAGAQNILAEYLAYIFVPTAHLKLEKCLLLYGQGANGKSVFSDIVFALLGCGNVSSYSLQNLTRHEGYQRAELQNKLVNYATEISGKLDGLDIFKQLVSGEPVEARQIYGKPFTMSSYAKLMFNCNQLPVDVEHTNAFFRRFMVVGFDNIIPEDKQDKQLAQKIISSELSGIFNWVLTGLTRLLEQKKFSYSESVKQQLEEYKISSDSVKMFLRDEGYGSSPDKWLFLKHLLALYQGYCREMGYNTPVGPRSFAARLTDAGLKVTRHAQGNVVFTEKTF